MSADELSEILRRVANGDEIAFRALVYTYSNRMLCHVHSFVQSNAVAEEIVQDIFLKIWNNREKLLLVHDFDAYLFIFSKNYIISFLRKKTLEVEVLQEITTPSDYQPDRQFLDKEFHKLLHQSINALPDQRRRVFELIYQEGYSQKEVADILGIATRTVRWNLNMALVALREILFRYQYHYLPILIIYFLFF